MNEQTKAADAESKRIEMMYRRRMTIFENAMQGCDYKTALEALKEAEQIELVHGPFED
jgi:hypothetical protein